MDTLLDIRFELDKIKHIIRLIEDECSDKNTQRIIVGCGILSEVMTRLIKECMDIEVKNEFSELQKQVDILQKNIEHQEKWNIISDKIHQLRAGYYHLLGTYGNERVHDGFR